MTEQQIEDAYEYMKGEHFEDAYQDDPYYLRDNCRAESRAYLSSRPFPRWPVEGWNPSTRSYILRDAGFVGDPRFADDVVCPSLDGI